MVHVHVQSSSTIQLCVIHCNACACHQVVILYDVCTVHVHVHWYMDMLACACVHVCCTCVVMDVFHSVVLSGSCV